MEYGEMLHRCFRCGWCKFPSDFSNINCPSYLKNSFETYSPGGRLWLIRGWLNGQIEPTERFREILYSCATCKNCTVTCGMPEIKGSIVDMIIEARQKLVSTGKLPLSVKSCFMEIYNNGNPFKKQQEQRWEWARGLGIPEFDAHEYLLYVGDEGAFDETAVKMTRTVAVLLKEMDISFGILGADEISDGNDVRAMGEFDLFAFIAEKNSELFKKRGVKKIITLSPHSMNAFKNEYNITDAGIEVFHYTQVLGLFSGKIRDGNLPLRVTYHDPCYLGRWNNQYITPRQVIQSIPGITFVEMPRNQAGALCCGGGGGNYYSAMLGSGSMSPSRVRIREAASAGADIVAVSCPICYKMLDDAVKDEGLEEKISVMDLAEVVSESKKIDGVRGVAKSII